MNDSRSHADTDEFVNQCSSKSATEKGSKKKKGKSTGNSKGGNVQYASEVQEPVNSKSKKNQKKGKATSEVSDSNSCSKKDGSRMDNPSFLSEESLIQKIKSLITDFEDEDPETVLAPLATHLRPMLLNSWMQRRKAAFTENSQKLKRLLDNLQQRLDEAFLNIQLYEKAMDLFEDDQSTAVILHKHLLRTAACQMVDNLLVNLDIHNKLSQGIQVDESQNSGTVSLTSAERLALAKCLSGSLSIKAIQVVESLEGKRVELFMNAVRDLAVESGLDLKRLDKKLERTLLHSYRKVYGKALQAHGRAISTVVSRLKDKLDDVAFKTLADYQGAAVTLLSLMSASTGNAEYCSSDSIISKRELLEGLMPVHTVLSFFVQKVWFSF